MLGDVLPITPSNIEQIRADYIRGLYPEVIKECKQYLEQDLELETEAELYVTLCMSLAHYHIYSSMAKYRIEGQKLSVKSNEICRKLGNPQLLFLSLYYSLSLHLVTGYIDEALKIGLEATSVFQKLEEKQYPNYKLLKALFLHLEINILFLRSLLEDDLPKPSEELLPKFQEMLSLALHEDNKIDPYHLDLVTDFYIELGNHYAKLNKLDKAMLQFEKARDITLKTQNEHRRADLVGAFAIIHRQLNNFEEYLKLSNEVIEIHNSIGNQTGNAKVYGSLSSYYYHIGEKKEFLEYSLRAYNIVSENGTNENTGYLDNVGYAYYQLGDLDKAEETFKKSHRLSGDWKWGYYSSQENLGIIAYLRGDLDKALELLEDSRKFYDKRDFKKDHAVNLWHQYKVLLSKGLVSKSVNALEQSLRIYQELDNLPEIAKALYSLVDVTSQNNMQELSAQYFKELETIIDLIEAPKIKKLLLLAEGILLKYSPDSKDRIKAEVYFDNLLQENLIFPIEIELLFHQCDLLLKEYISTGKNRVLEKLKKYLDRLLKISTQNNILRLKIEVLWFKAQILFLEENYGEAMDLLDLAFSFAKDKGYVTLADRISSSKSETSEKLMELEDKDLSELSIEEKMDILQIEDRFRELQESQVFDISDLQFKSHF